MAERRESLLNPDIMGIDPSALGLSFSVSTLIASFIFGIVGLWLFREAKKRGQLANILIAIALMVYPMFVSSVWKTWAIGIGLCVGAYFLWE